MNSRQWKPRHHNAVFSIKLTAILFLLLIAVAMKSEPIESNDAPAAAAAVWWNSDIEAMRAAYCKQEN